MSANNEIWPGKSVKLCLISLVNVSTHKNRNETTLESEDKYLLKLLRQNLSEEGRRDTER